MEKQKKRKSIKLLVVIIILALIAIAAAACFIIRKNKNTGMMVETQTAVRTDLEQTVDLSGIITGSDSADVYSRSSNRIAEILVKEGDKVKAGDKLAVLEGDSSGITYDKAKLALEDAKRDYENKAVLYQSGFISEDEYRQAESTYKNAELSLQEINTEDDAYVTSPIDGTVTRVYTSVGKLAGGSSASSLFLIENIDQLQMVLRVSEYDIKKVKIGQNVIVKSDILDNVTVNGEVVSIAPTGERKAEGSSEMVVPVTVNLDSKGTDLFAGVNGKASIITGEAKDALTVPVDSILNSLDDDSKYIFVVRDGVLKKCTVSILLEGDFDVAIDDEGDVIDGDQVVLSPDYSMEDGMVVQTMPQTGNADE